ncbi:MAG: chemotaxis protein CheW [Syntrophales bacterium]|nr:chemotaxis protein CheW [Syntrophales bacterium]
MNRSIRLVNFNLDDQQYALFLSAVIRIIRVVEITSLPKAPEIVLGVINMHGRIIPVFDIRKRFRLPQREMQLDDQLIVAATSKRTVALLVNSVSDVIEIQEAQMVAGEQILSGLAYVEGVVKTEDGMILIHDLEQFLSLQEEEALQEAIVGLS